MGTPCASAVSSNVCSGDADTVTRLLSKVTRTAAAMAAEAAGASVWAAAVFTIEAAIAVLNCSYRIWLAGTSN